VSDLFARVRSAFHHRQGEFLKIELEACLRSANLASLMYQDGNREAAERSSADAEKCYTMVLRFLSDPKDSKRLTIKATQEFTASMKGLRKTPDGLQRFRN
jgi:hypothetical protein